MATKEGWFRMGNLFRWLMNMTGKVKRITFLKLFMSDRTSDVYCYSITSSKKTW